MTDDKKYIVLCIADRDIEDHAIMTGIESAQAAAEKKLKDHMAAIGCLGEYESGEERGEEWNNVKDGNGWCNYKGSWDVHMIPLES